jgi:tRNA pseudouridine55 synthase
MATGLLPLCFGEATKVSAMMLNDNKRYQVEMKLGVVTDTGDAEGKIIEEKPIPELSLDEIEQCLQSFTGEIDQIPPMYSALKHKGRKLYELAREGKIIERKARKVTIFELHLLNVTTNSLTLDVFCSKGTYIRSLAEDIGHKLGCGGTVVALRRLQAGQFRLEDALTLEQLQEKNLESLMACLLDVDKPLDGIPVLELSSKQAVLIKHGQQINVDNKQVEAKQGKVRMYSEQVFLGLGEMLLDGKLVPKKIFNLNSETI